MKKFLVFVLNVKPHVGINRLLRNIRQRKGKVSERGFNTDYWADSFVETLPAEGKLLYIYLWTNPQCNQAGLYEITLDRVAYETKLPIDSLPSLLKALEPKVKWYGENNIVWIKNFLKRQAKSPKFLVAASKAMNSIRIPDELRADFELYNQNLLEGVAPSQHISLTKRECVAIRDAFICQYCGKEIQDESDYEMDHIVPIICGGKDNYPNLAASCRDCNQKKFDKTPAEAGLPEPNPSSFHGAQATYLLKTNRSLFEKWLIVFPQRQKVAFRVIGNVDEYQSILNNINQYQLQIPSSASASANANLKDIKGRGEELILSSLCEVYEKEIGVISVAISQQLIDFATSYKKSGAPLDWIPEAFAEAANHNKRSWAYARAILERWILDGKTKKPSGKRDTKHLPSEEELAKSVRDVGGLE